MIKQVIVMRNDLNMRKGKMMAQACHASMKVFFDMMTTETRDVPVFHRIPESNDGYTMTSMVFKTLMFHKDDPRLEWMEGIFTKIVLQGYNRDHIKHLAEQAFDLGIPFATIEDHGNTEFKCKHCNYFDVCGCDIEKCDKMRVTTCIALGPCESEVLDKLTGDLKLF